MVVGGDSLAERKPHPLPLLHCIQQQNITASQTLMIGDSSNDVEAARRAGIDCIVVSYGYNHGESIYDCQPQQVVDSLAELIEDDLVRRQAWSLLWFFDGGLEKALQKKRTEIKTIEKIHDDLSTIWAIKISRL